MSTAIVLASSVAAPAVTPKAADPAETRRKRGLAIAAVSKISRKQGRWVVPSQSGNGAYYVTLEPPDPKTPLCTCPDHEATGKPCKHVYAVRYVIDLQSHPDGLMTLTETLTLTRKTTAPRKTYRQDWTSYNAAQVNEKAKFQTLIHDLCRGIIEPPRKPTRGMQPMRLADMTFAAVFKVYSTVSGRRFSCDLSDAHAKGYLSRLPHYNTVFSYLENAALTPILRALIVQSALPLKAVEVDFAVDSSGFTSCRFVRWFDHKYGKPMQVGVTQLVDICSVCQGVHRLYYSCVNAPRCFPDNYIHFLIAAPGPVSCTEAVRVQPHSPFAPAHDSFNRLLNRVEPDPEELWQEAEPAVEKERGLLIIDDSTNDKPYAKHISLVTRHWSGKHRKVVRGINLISVVWTDGDRKIPCDYRLYSKADGKTKNDHFWEMMLMAKGRGFSPECVCFDGWYASLENLKQVRDFGWKWLTRLKGNRSVTPGEGRRRTLDSAEGTILHLTGYGSVLVFRSFAKDGVAEYWATNDLTMEPGVRQHHAEVSFAIENYHRELKQFCGVEKCQVRSERAQRNHIGMAIRAFLRLEWHFFTTGISAFEAKLRLVREAVRSYLARPAFALPVRPTA